MPYFSKKIANINDVPSRVRTVVIGGGIHGCGVCHDLATREWKDTILLEKGEIGGATSSSSTKLIHGGLRYLQRISQFGMVLKSLEERRLLISLVPDLVKPLELIYPVLKKGGMPRFMVKIGLFIYDRLAGKRSIGKHKLLSSEQVSELAPHLNQKKFSSFYSFWDGQTDDLALTVRVASSASKLGAQIFEGIEVKSIKAVPDGWALTVVDGEKREKVITCLYVINAAGPWSNILLENSEIVPKSKAISNKGVHLIVKNLGLKSGVFFESPKDGRIFFVLPWKGKTLIGTTESIYVGNPDNQKPEQEDIEYLLNNINSYFDIELTESDIIEKFSGLRWLAVEENESISSTSREVVVTDHDSERGFMLTIYGGKLTSYRNLSEAIGDNITRHFGTFRRSKTNIKSYWADVHEVIKPLPNVKERFSKFK